MVQSEVPRRGWQGGILVISLKQNITDCRREVGNIRLQPALPTHKMEIFSPVYKHHHYHRTTVIISSKKREIFLIEVFSEGREELYLAVRCIFASFSWQETGDRSLACIQLL